jgi:phage shock protein E
MNWNIVLVSGLIVAVFIGLKRLGLVSAKAARRLLKQGALIVDVRSAVEFRTGHLPDAVNIPLDELPDSLARAISDKNQVLLLYCLSGARSGSARRMLKGMGYQNVFNLGSLTRARKILGNTGGN